MRTYTITNITPSANPSVPASIEVFGDATAVFHGKEWIDELGNRSPFYTYDNDVNTAAPTPPLGTTVLVATTFEIIGNANGKYNGRYTVYTKASPGGFDSVELTMGGDTLVRLNEAMPTDGAGLELTTGTVVHVSTYLFTVTGETDQLVLEQSTHTDRPVEIVGRLSAGWGEVLFQNLLRQAQSFAGPSAPLNPFQGQLWFDTVSTQLMIKPTALAINDWQMVNASFITTAPYRHTESVASLTWNITHNLNLPAPYIAGAEFFVDTGGGVYKPILPADVTYVDANSMSVTFSGPYAGYAVIRQ